MTVSYQHQVASSTSGGFTRLLFIWRGSLYKLIYRELFLFLVMFAALSALYRHVFNPTQKKEFEQIVVYCDTFIKLIPLSFVLGFYVSYVAQRWWKQYQAIPWPDKLMHLVALYVIGNDEHGRMLRRALMRYLNLSLILVLRSISSAVKRRFPTLDHVVDSGYMTPLELELFQSVPSVEFNTYWIPCTWFVNLLKEARRNHRLPDPQGLKLIMEEFNEFRTKCGLLWSYDWVSIPLVYTQVVTLATYSFFAVALFGRQYIEDTEKFQLKIDIYLPVFTVLQFFFFMGLLKVAEQLINPFGDDDEDFELNWLIDRHTKVSYLGVDTLMNRCPPLVKDIYFDAENLTLPYTEAAAAYKKKTYRGSVANMTVPEEKQTMFLPDIIEEEENCRTSPTPRTSTISLATRNNDSPVTERRQISGPPQTIPKMHQNRSDTIIQLDIQEPPLDNEQPENHRIIREAVRRFSALAKCSTPRIDQNRKPFFTLTKTPKVVLQPWPSALNLSQSNRQIVDTPIVSESATNPLDGYWSKIMDSTSLQQTPQDSPEAENEGGFVNSGFSQERTDDACKACDCNAENASDSTHSDVCQYQCRHTEICHHLKVPDSTDSPSIAGQARPRNRYPKYLVRRHKSVGDSCRKKSSPFQGITEAKHSLLRRKTTDCIPTIQEPLHRVRSTPNLALDKKNVQCSTKDVPDNETDPCEQQVEMSKL